MALTACGFYVAHASSEGVCGYSLLRVRTFEAASAHSQARDCALSATRLRAHFSPPPHIPVVASAGAAGAGIRFTVPRGRSVLCIGCPCISYFLNGFVGNSHANIRISDIPTKYMSIFPTIFHFSNYYGTT